MHLAADEQPRFLLHRLAQVLVELRIQLGVGHDAGELAQLEPPRGEVVDQRVRPRIAEHALDLPLEHGRIVQRAANRRVAQLVVRDAAPEKERQPRGQVEIARDDTPCRPRSPAGSRSTRKRKLGAARMRSIPRWMPASKPPIRRGPPGRNRAAVSTSLLGHGPPIGARRERRQDLLRARLLCRGIFGAADEHLAPARRICPSARRAVRTADRDDLHRRIAVVVLVGRAAETGLRRLQHAFRFPESSDERHADLVRARLHRDAHLEMRVGGVHVFLEFGIALRVPGEVLRGRHPLRFAADGEPLQAHAVETDVELVPLAHADDVVVLLPPQQDLDRVLGVERKVDSESARRPASRTAGRRRDVRPAPAPWRS